MTDKLSVIFGQSSLNDITSLSYELDENVIKLIDQDINFNDFESIKQNWVNVLATYQKYVSVVGMLEMHHARLNQWMIVDGFSYMRSKLRQEVSDHRQELSTRLSKFDRDWQLPELSDGFDPSFPQTNPDPRASSSSSVERPIHQAKSAHSSSSSPINPSPIDASSHDAAQLVDNTFPLGSGRSNPAAPPAPVDTRATA